MSTAHFSVCNRKGEFFVDRMHHAVKDMRSSFERKGQYSTSGPRKSEAVSHRHDN